jgi:hypothetical protein
MARQLVLAAGVGAGAAVTVVAGFHVGAWLVDVMLSTFFRVCDRWATRQDMESAE